MEMKNLLIKGIYNDAAQSWALGFQDPASPISQAIIELHDNIMFYIVTVLIGVGWGLLRVILSGLKDNKIAYKYADHGTLIEIVWTIAPAFVLIAIAFPSFKLLYLMDEVIDPAITIKAIGRQWYWSYEYTDMEGNLEFDSYMVPTEELEKGQLRLLEVDNRVVLPIDTHVRVIVTGGDVLHSWAIPSLGVKMDAVPGRLNHTSILINREGVYYGQCSEICGVGHGFMPIVIEGVSLDKYLSWLESES